MIPIALLSDFGNSDPYVGIMKSVILDELLRIEDKIERGPIFLDLGHEMAPQQISSASYALASAWEYLPERCAVLSVVDPGVGSERRELIAVAGERALVTPDNGTVTLLERRFGPLRYYRASERVRAELVERRPAYASTFDGRDLFAPLAGRIAAEGAEAVVGTELAPDEVVRLPWAAGSQQTSGERAAVVHVDRFGNAILSLHYSECRDPEKVAVSVTPRAGAGAAVELPLRGHYAEVKVGEPLCYWGSAGHLEIAVRNGSAAAEYALEIGGAVELSQ